MGGGGVEYWLRLRERTDVHGVAGHVALDDRSVNKFEIDEFEF